MLTSAAEVTTWLKTQEELVVLLGAYLQPIREWIERHNSDPAGTDDMNEVYQLHVLVREFDAQVVHSRLTALGLMPYFNPLVSPHHILMNNVTNQTIPASRLPFDQFVPTVARGADVLAEVMMAVAKVPPPAFSITMAAGTPFSAYLLISRLVEQATDFLYIVDAYADASLFSRYLFRVQDGVRVSVRTNPEHWGKTRQAQFEEAESLFSAQHPEYDRADRDDLHARYLITETGGWLIDGSVKDIADKKNCPIHTITPNEREQVIADYFTEVAE